ncbi:hypothetical protein HRG_008184 [Hirsutella rhossiliensis]|uniref:Uncharacterized protein n=1 Tax=Hirsutella rhossiliensis TaxID=111463 RepID=A0A9P8MVJ8_9HYPO|nr:uncharacterized protein HRG_08184 [Hirsutella rhossiliensis]KAH0961031.1 hypothetical protein HRG_08184 [Hirsutella rhossiliensis]
MERSCGTVVRKELIYWLAKGVIRRDGVEDRLAPDFADYPIVFTHGDIAARNAMEAMTWVDSLVDGAEVDVAVCRRDGRRICSTCSALDALSSSLRLGYWESILIHDLERLDKLVAISGSQRRRRDAGYEKNRQASRLHYVDYVGEEL